MKFSRSLAILLLPALQTAAQESTGVSTIIPPGAPSAVPRAVPVNRSGIIGTAPAMPAPSPEPIALKPAVGAPLVVDPSIQPSWETQKLARTFTFTIPAPRGQIVDRHGTPLAQTRIAHNLAIVFPTPPIMSDAEASRYIASQVATAQTVTKRTITLDAARALKHYKARGIMPLIVAQNLSHAEMELLKRANPPGLQLQPIYQRVYPQGSTAAHIVGYVGRQGNYPTGPVENNELLWPESEGRSGIELTFNQQLTGQPGVMQVSYDAQGRKSTEKVVKPPVPGQNVVLTLDLPLQRSAERSIAVTKRPGAMAITDPNNGEVLALASWPSFDPNAFIPSISATEFKQLSEDETHPLFPRAFGSAYPPGSTFKVITGLAAMNEGIVDPDDRFEGSPSMEIGGRTFNNHTRKHQGMLAFPAALIVSCNTYFYRVGLRPKVGAAIGDYASRLGLGKKTGIPVIGEEDGKLMTSDYMWRVHKRALMPGDLANLSIGQGDTITTPLQMAHAMGAIGNGGTVFQPRLVLQVQGPDGKIALGFDMRIRDQIDIDKDVMKAIRAGMVGVVHNRGGTATNAAVPGVKMAAKTGTAQWGSGRNEKVAAWFAGFIPAEKPKYAFAAVYEGREARDDVHGGSHAAPIVARVMREFVKPEPKESKRKGGLRQKKREEEEEADEMNDEGVPRARSVRRDGNEEDVQ